MKAPIFQIRKEALKVLGRGAAGTPAERETNQ